MARIVAVPDRLRTGMTKVRRAERWSVEGDLNDLVSAGKLSGWQASGSGYLIWWHDDDDRIAWEVSLKELDCFFWGMKFAGGRVR
jgi:hypothetical protein